MCVIRIYDDNDDFCESKFTFLMYFFFRHTCITSRRHHDSKYNARSKRK